MLIAIATGCFVLADLASIAHLSAMRVLQSTAGLSAVAYAVVTFLWSLMAKVIVTRFFFDYPVVILMLQTTSTLLIVEILRVLGVLKLAPYSFEKGRHVFLPSLLFSISQWITVSSFEGIGLPTLASVKRFAPFLICIGMGTIGRQQRVDVNKALLVLGISFATAVTVNLEMSLDRYSFFYGILAASLQATAYIQFEMQLQVLSASEMVYMHSFNSLIIFLLADIVQDEVRDAFMYMITSAHPLFGGFCLVYLLFGVLSYWATFNCLEKVGALNLQIVANLRAAVEVFVAYYSSFYLFYGVSPGLTNWMFLAVSAAAALYYYRTNNADQAVKAHWASRA